MNNIKKSIKWADLSWNPVTGCLHSCQYCYARNFAKRLKGMNHPSYQNGFVPSFHEKVLSEPLTEKWSDQFNKIFVCSMADLFGSWVPKEWIENILEVVKKCPQYTFMFLTKNPIRYGEFNFPDNCMLGATITTHKEADNLPFEFLSKTNKTFLCIEPIMEEIDLNNSYVAEYFIDLIILGSETGNRKNKIICKKEWIDNIEDFCSQNGTKLFLKDSVLKINQK